MDGYYFRTEGMCVGYDREPVIKDITIKLPQGEILTLIGPNGAGKSTVLKSIARQLQLIGGAVYLGQTELTQMSGAELSRQMAVVFTERIRTELMTCEEVVATGRYPYTGRLGMLTKADYAKVEEAMELVQIAGMKHQDFAKISDGQKQRVMLARAICQEPEIVILDEPTSYLDVKYKLEFLSVLLELRDKKRLTVVMSLHELELARLVSDKILCLKGETVERYGTPGEIFETGFIERLFDISEERFVGNEKLLSYIKKLGTVEK